MSTKPKMTPWFVNGEKPARKGVYQQRCGLGKSIGYQRWDGAQWHSWESTPERAARANFVVDECSQNDPWRGLAEKP